MIKKNFVSKETRNMGSQFLFDKTLSMRERGIQCTLFILSPNRKITYAGLAKFHGEKEKAIKSCMKRLQKKGYIKYEHVKDVGNSTKIRMIIYDESHDVDEVSLDELFEDKNETYIIKVRKDKPFLTVGKDAFYNHELSFKAVGLLMTLLAMKEDQNTSIEALKEKVKDGRDSISETLDELIKAGYITERYQEHKNGDWSGVCSLVYDVAQPIVAREDKGAQNQRTSKHVGAKGVVQKTLTRKVQKNKDIKKVNNQYSKVCSTLTIDQEQELIKLYGLDIVIETYDRLITDYNYPSRKHYSVMCVWCKEAFEKQKKKNEKILKKNKFNNFQQRKYDADDYERMLLTTEHN